MPRKMLMSWTGSKTRWRKMYKGVMHTVYCSDLDLPEVRWTELESYQAANQWWLAKRAEIDGRVNTRSLPPETEEYLASLKRKQEYAEREGLGSEAADYAAAIHDAERRIDEDGEVDQPEVDPMTVQRLRMLEQMGFTPPPDLDPATLDIVLGSEYTWHDRQRREKVVASSKQIGPHLDNWFALVRRRAKPASLINIHAYHREFGDLKAGKALVLHRNMDVAVIDEAKFAEVFNAIDGREDKAPATKKKEWTFFKQFVSYLSEHRLVPLPHNFRSKLLVFRTPTRSKVAPDVAAIRGFLDGLPDRLRLYALLALNCAMNNVDIGRLRHEQVNWEKGTLTRKRVKTEDNDNVPTVTYELWPETLRLLNQEKDQRSDYLLTSAGGRCLYVAEKVGDSATHYDRIKSQWRDYFKRRGGKRYTIKQFRFFGADLLKDSQPHRTYHEPFLGHSPKTVAERNYSSNENVAVACRYLRSLFYPDGSAGPPTTGGRSRRVHAAPAVG